MSSPNMPSKESRSAQIRARLKHPIIDSDGHVAEFEPEFFDYLKETAGDSAVKRLKALPDSPLAFRWYRLSEEERRAHRLPRPHWWVHPTLNTLDRATSSLPKLLHRRLDEMGIDFTIVYPSLGLFLLHLGDDELRRAACRALNNLNAAIFREYADRITPVAVIPMHTPEEAIGELRHAVKIGLKAAVMAGWVRRPIAGAEGAAKRYAFWMDTLGLDSEYDYDPVWEECAKLRIAPTFHSPSAGIGLRNSISNFMYNHIGHFAASSEAICKALFFGGVTRRFPQLRFGFLEGGVGWASGLLGDLAGHWEKHNPRVLERFDPASLDEQLMLRLFDQYSRYRRKLAEMPREERSQLLWGAREDSAANDEWARCEIAKVSDIRDLFVPKFYFGCEGDDRLTALAFDRGKNAFGARLNAIYSSDLGHWDLPDMRDAAAEAWELAEHGSITEDDFRDFVFANPVRAKAEVNPDFFKGTMVEGAARSLLEISATIKAE
jgi:predicted TIM-barrel fold metal-dependent hydrolase